MLQSLKMGRNMNNRLEQEELIKLQNKIRYNFAVLEDYERYERILFNHGYNQNDFISQLQRNGFTSLEHYYYQRNHAQTIEEKAKVDKFLAWLLGIGGALLLFWAIKKNKE